MRYEKTKLYDLAASMPLLVFYGWVVWTVSAEIAARIRTFDGTAQEIVGIWSLALSLIFGGILVTLLLFRRVPTAKSIGWRPRFAAVMGTFGGVTLSLIPLSPLPLAVALLTMVPVIAGTTATIVVALWLGRQFSIMPEARKLVTGGPYAGIRHPLYLCEAIALLGIALQHEQPWSLVVFAVQLTFQILRMDYEEQVLVGAFPEYIAYAARTSRLIPGMY